MNRVKGIFVLGCIIGMCSVIRPAYAIDFNKVNELLKKVEVYGEKIDWKEKGFKSEFRGENIMIIYQNSPDWKSLEIFRGNSMNPVGIGDEALFDKNIDGLFNDGPLDHLTKLYVARKYLDHEGTEVEDIEDLVDTMTPEQKDQFYMRLVKEALEEIDKKIQNN